MNHWTRSMVATCMPLAILFTLSAQPIIAQSNKNASSTGTIFVAELSDETISPAAARYLDRTLREAQQRKAVCLVIELDTPGGLLTSTRRIVKRIVGSEIPVVVYVSPSGSRAASAGVFVTLSSHVAAMAPGTTIGAAHPVRIGSLPTSPRMPSPPGSQPPPEEEPSDNGNDSNGQSPLEQKAINDTVAWARALAELRGRNADWAEQTVSDSLSVTAAEAEKAGAIDLVAADLDDLLTQLDGRTVELPDRSVKLATAGARIERVPMWWGERLLAILGQPNIAFLLMVFGFYGILFELYNPGWGIPGTLGLVCMLLGLAGLAVLPVNYLGFALLIVALCLLAAEVYVTSYGALAAAGTVCLVIGGVMLVDSPTGFTRVSWSVLLPVAGATAAIVAGLAVGVARSMRSEVRTGGEGLLGETGRALSGFEPQDDHFSGAVKVHGERWRAVSPHRLSPQQQCRVTGRDGLTLRVEPLAAEKPDESRTS